MKKQQENQQNETKKLLEEIGQDITLLRAKMVLNPGMMKNMKGGTHTGILTNPGFH